MKRKILFDVSTLNPRHQSGVGVYILELFRHLRMESDFEFTPVLKASRLKKKKEIEEILDAGVQILWPWKNFTEDVLYHNPDFKLNFIRAPLKVVTIHDLVVFEEQYNAPSFYVRGQRSLDKVLRSPVDAFIANSEATKQRILLRYPDLAGKVFTTLLGCDRKGETPRVSGTVEEMIRSKGIGSFLFFVGNIELRKNIIALIEAFEKLALEFPGLNLLLAGRIGFRGQEVKDRILKSSFCNRIFHFDNLDNGQIEECFSKAQLFIFPSFYEGFGIPVLEAMRNGCPVVISPEPALIEVAGGAARVSAGFLGADLEVAIRELLQHPEQMRLMQSKGKERALQLTWKACAEQTLSVYDATFRGCSSKNKP